MPQPNSPPTWLQSVLPLLVSKCGSCSTSPPFSTLLDFSVLKSFRDSYIHLRDTNNLIPPPFPQNRSEQQIISSWFDSPRLLAISAVSSLEKALRTAVKFDFTILLCTTIAHVSVIADEHETKAMLTRVLEEKSVHAVALCNALVALGLTMEWHSEWMCMTFPKTFIGGLGNGFLAELSSLKLGTAGVHGDKSFARRMCAILSKNAGIHELYTEIERAMEEFHESGQLQFGRIEQQVQSIEVPRDIDDNGGGEGTSARVIDIPIITCIQDMRDLMRKIRTESFGTPRSTRNESGSFAHRFLFGMLYYGKRIPNSVLSIADELQDEEGGLYVGAEITLSEQDEVYNNIDEKQRFGDIPEGSTARDIAEDLCRRYTHMLSLFQRAFGGGQPEATAEAVQTVFGVTDAARKCLQTEVEGDRQRRCVLVSPEILRPEHENGFA